jgi:hypothetical protein
MAKKIWLTEMARRTGNPDRTVRNWWQAYCDDSGCTHTPRQATDVERHDFWTWLQIQGEKEADAQAQRRAAKEMRQRQAACTQAVASLERLIARYDFPVVLEEVIEVICSTRGRLIFRPHRPVSSPPSTP